MAFRHAKLPQSFTESMAKTKVTYRQLGRSGLRISNPIFGGLSIGDSKWDQWILDKEEAMVVLNEAYNRGITTWDTANVYSNGASEEIMGATLREYNIPRSKVVLMTKIFRVMPDIELEKYSHDRYKNVAFFETEADQSKDHVNHWGLSRAAIMQTVDDSLARLGTDYIDVLQIHRSDPHVPPEETMRALHDLVTCGKVRYLGASSMWAHELAILQHTAERNGWNKFSSIQLRYNLLYREEEREMIRYCNRTGVGILAWEALGAGHLARPLGMNGTTRRAKSLLDLEDKYPELSPQDTSIIGRVEEVAQRRNWPMSHVSLAWLNERAITPIIGFNSVHRIQEALDARGKILTAEERAYLEEPYMPVPVVGHK
ncbi:hypothetical protein WAI453_007435 [Rhynchosporium graminicola]